jgi:N-acetylglucosamine kinase-like BadF-type ATPase
VNAVFSELPKPQDIALFAGAVSKAAQEGDKVAKEILTDAGRELAALAESLALKLGIANQKITVGAVGGVWKSRIVWEVFKRELKKKLPRVLFRGPVEFPVVGSLIMAMRKKGIKVSEKNVAEFERAIRSMI